MAKEDWSDFNPSSFEEIAEVLGEEFSELGSAWWEENRVDNLGYLEALARASIQTRIALEQDRISEAVAKRNFDLNKRLLKGLLEYQKFMRSVLLQSLSNKFLQVVGWAVFNKTGINLYPSLVKPKAK